LALFGLRADGLWVILGTASRGALLALEVVVVFFLVHATLRQRLALILSGTLLAAIYVVALPAQTVNRLTTLFGPQNQEAAESAESRAYLFKKSVQFTLEYPLFGVGPDQFSNFEGKTSQAKGEHGSWHATHCTWTQISSECGIPALIFYAGGIGSALLMVYRTFRAAKRERSFEIADACFCYLLAMTGFLVALTFLASAYSYCLPAMIGLAVVLSSVANEQLAANTTFAGAGAT
jgi:O-antigen ligase